MRKLLATFLIFPSLSFAVDRFEGSWKYDIPGEGAISSIWIARYGKTYVGEVQGGSRRGRLFVSKLKGWEDGQKLYARICGVPDDENDERETGDMQECLENSEHLSYFISDGRELTWYQKEGSTWKLVMTLKAPNKARKAKKAVEVPSPNLQLHTDPQVGR
jgi:hypothetical protein